MPKSQGDEIDFVFELRPGRGRHRICRYCVDASAGSFRPALMRVGMLYALAGRPAIQRGRDLIHINSPFGDLLHTSRYSNRGKMTLMRAVIKLMLLSLLTFAATFAARRIFFWDVMPVSWSQDPSPTGALMTAYLLLSLENVAAAVAAIALMAGLALWISGRRRDGATSQS
jgi:hypothetical protein